MSFHGGLVGVIIVAIWYSKKNNQKTFDFVVREGNYKYKYFGIVTDVVVEKEM